LCPFPPAARPTQEPASSANTCRGFAGTPPAITVRLNAEINKALADPAVRESFLQQAQESMGGTAEQFLQLFRDDYAKYER
jgi:tripartite-type tricarboxylate transporter receptor subunit TctC